MSDDNHTLPYPKAGAEHPTLVVPPLERTSDAAASAPRRRRWPWVVLGIVVVIAVLGVVAELIARAVLPGIVRSIVIEQLDLPADQQLDVEASGILLPQLIGGTLDSLHLSTDSVTIGGITGAADVRANGVSLRGDDLRAAVGTIRIDQSQFTSLIAGAELPIDELAFAAPDVTARGSLSVLGIGIPIELTVTPGADAGELTLTPVRLLVGGITLDAGEVGDRFGDIGARLTETQHICIADQLPAGLHLTGLSIDGSEAVIDLSVDGGIISNEALQQNGVCG